MVLWYFTLNTLRISLQKEILKDGAMFSFRTQRRLTTACYKTGSSLSNSMVDVVIKGVIFVVMELFGICIVVNTGIYTGDKIS